MNLFAFWLFFALVCLNACIDKQEGPAPAKTPITFNKIYKLQYIRFYSWGTTDSIGVYKVGQLILNKRQSCFGKPYNEPYCEPDVLDEFVLNKFEFSIDSKLRYTLRSQYELSIPRYRQPWWNAPYFDIDRLDSIRVGDVQFKNDSVYFKNILPRNVGFVTLIPFAYGRGIEISKFYPIQYKGDSLLLTSEQQYSMIKATFVFY